jgi:predicted N-acetyltransferase YhbS
MHYRNPSAQLQVLEVRRGAAQGLGGEVRYHPAFELA